MCAQVPGRTDRDAEGRFCQIITGLLHQAEEFDGIDAANRAAGYRRWATAIKGVRRRAAKWSIAPRANWGALSA